VLPMLSSVPHENTYPKARQAAEKAMSLDDSLAEAHLAAAEVKLYSDWDFSGAEREFLRSLTLDSNYAQAHQWYAEFLSLMGRHSEAVAEIRAAQKLDPSSMIIYHQAGQVFQAARQYDEALKQFQKALQIQPGFGPTYGAVALTYRRQGRYPECVKAQMQANAYWDPSGTEVRDLKSVAHAYSDSGVRGFFLATLEFDKKHPPSRAAYRFAGDYAELEENDQALQWLQKSWEAREVEFLGVRNDPEFDRLRSDPRFQKLLQNAGLPRTTDINGTTAKQTNLQPPS
jgi:tetratricopeptide (TPR) repeat protein